VDKIKNDFITTQKTIGLPTIEPDFKLVSAPTPEVIQLLKKEAQEKQQERDSRPIVGVWIGEVGDLDKLPDPSQIILPAEHVVVEKRQHRGLRCPKCLALLVRDQDFDYKNGELWVDPTILSKGWEGIKMKGSTIYCQNMHSVGTKRFTTWTNESRFVPVLKVSKTTFKENFLDNPEFKDSSLIVNKLIHANNHRDLS